MFRDSMRKLISFVSKVPEAIFCEYKTNEMKFMFEMIDVCSYLETVGDNPKLFLPGQILDYFYTASKLQGCIILNDNFDVFNCVR